MSLPSPILRKVVAIFQGLQYACLLPLMPLGFFIEQGRFWWILAALYGVLAVPIVVVLLPFYFGFQAVSSLFGFCLYNRLKIRAIVDENGIHFQKSDAPFSFQWSQITRIRCIYARPFPPDDVRFRDETALEISVSDGIFWVDEWDVKAVRDFAAIHSIALEDFSAPQSESVYSKSV